MRFLADAGVAQRVVDWLRADGHDVVHLRDRGLQRLTDREVFELASAEGRILITFDLDFGEIVASSGSHVVSVILFRLRDTGSSHVTERLRSVLERSARQVEHGAGRPPEEA
ncbi:MAG: DUF5615 family PIN-like protein [Armatimonadota bacterium]|nr:DUF5615 family PIN-like protein [Armatimonadota bacterium]MDR7428256.1 DUF5615 family PIN-like protein [Armatimonadota bacterium]MDR7463228.1 DUF5615 family PIN-like protein [Armatimonadota bacterium]MDR7469392.1 DUF5615 family PIN-like protein [Armatimonadota bacterium]MDR7474772.1 DUF5615 family PIN-like protein [Armatimonadota bacterium]